MQNQNLEAALNLAAHGLFVFPAQGGSNADEAKRPHRSVGSWPNVATTNEFRIREWWANFPDAAPAIACAPSGLLVIDADCHAGRPDGVAAWEALVAEHGEVDAPIVRTAGGGLHVLFRRPSDFEPSDSSGTLPPGIDVRGAGYVIGVGARYGAGGVYTQVSGDLASIPQTPPWLLARLHKAGPALAQAATALRALPVLVSMPAAPERVQAYAATALANEVAKVRDALPGERNNTANSSAFSIGTMVAAGWLSESEAYSALVGAVAGWPDARKTIDTLRRGLRDGLAHPRPALPDELTVDHAAMVAPLLATHDAQAADTRLVEQADGAIIDSATGEVVSAHGEAEASGFPLTLHPGFSLMENELVGPPRGLIGFPPGLVGWLAQWIVDTSRRPQPVLALGAALAIVGTAAGQRVYGPTGAGLHLYVLGIGRTAVGKDRPLKACVSALKAAGLDRLVGGSSFISMQAVINSTERNPVSLWAMDEFGSFLKRINGKNASSWEGAVSGALRTMWSAGYDTHMTQEAASCPRREIFAPCLSIFGVSTPEEFLESVSDGDVKNGLLNRMLILPQARHVVDSDPKIRDLRLPAKLVTALRELRGGDPASLLVDVAAPATPDGVAPLWLEWDNAAGWEGAAERSWRRGLAAPLDALQASEELNGGRESDFFCRTPEMALRIASIIAVGRGSTTVNVVDVMWGAELAAKSAHAFREAFRSHVSSSDHAERVEFVERVIKARRMITRSDLTRAAAKRMDSRQLSGVLAMLVEAGKIAAEQVRRGTRGPSSAAYRWVS